MGQIVPGGEAWPVGSVFIAVVSTNPATLLGYGTWSAFATGRTLVGFDSGQTEFDTVEETGGAKTHALTIAELAVHGHTGTTTSDAHTHTFNLYTTQGGAGTGFTATVVTGGNTLGTTAARTTSSDSHSHTFTTNNAGSGTAHNNLQPYIVVYMWKRTA